MSNIYIETESHRAIARFIKRKHAMSSITTARTDVTSSAVDSKPGIPLGRLSVATLAVLALLVVAVLVWQGITSSGNPDPTKPNLSPAAAALNTGILVFREGLEAILVLAALTASLTKGRQGYWKPVAWGAGLSFLASIVTWFIVVGVMSSINASALHIQAATGLLAIVVLLVIMNWFFHNIYWAGWIGLHNRRKKELLSQADQSSAALFRGLMLVGFTSVYREGFEVVLFLQSLRLRAGSTVVAEGTVIGLSLTAAVAVVMFVLHYRLPYKRMLVFTGVLLCCVLMVMVGESVQEMQQAGWLPATAIGISMPDWLNTWFGIFPTIQSLSLQATSVVLVVGSYFLARRKVARPAPVALPIAKECVMDVCPSHGRSKCQECSFPQCFGD